LKSRIPTLDEIQYLDWNNSIEILNKAYESGLFVLVIGPKGTGKTSLVRDFAKSKNADLESINFSLRTRESHLVGSKTLTEGTVGFDEGLLIKSMKEGSILYLDEINAAEADVLLRLDEALDDRRQVVLKESSGEMIKAKEGWFVIATINPLTHVGTKELPPQLLSRFPIRIRLEYPPEEIELQIVKKYVSDAHDEELKQGINLANNLRQAAAVEELYYSPSMRETISYGKLLDAGISAKEAANIVFGNVYAQWGNVEYQKVSDIITSMFGN
jgi:nitric oxide reductase NorQ protein